MNVPQLRFSGFVGEWEEVAFEQVARINMGQSPSGDSYNTEMQGEPLINGPTEFGEVYPTPVQWTTKPSKFSKPGDTLLCVRGSSIGRMNLSDARYCIGRGVAAISGLDSKTTSPYMKYVLEKEVEKILKRSTGSTFPNISGHELKQSRISIPSLKEQERIAAFLTALDQKREKQQEKIEKLEQFKKGMMQKVFSQELRFRDDDGGEFAEWEETTLGEVCISMQYGMNTAAKEFDGKNKYIRITDIDEDSRRYIEHGKVSPLGKLSEDYRIKAGDILFARTGASTGKSYLYKESDGRMYYAGFLIRARVKGGVDSRFVYYQTFLKEYNQWVKVMSMRSGQPGINAQEYSSYKFRLPSIDEQIKIAEFLDVIGNKMEMEREKLVVLEGQKKGFMQGMFI